MSPPGSHSCECRRRRRRLSSPRMRCGRICSSR
jgi:hypothetical protein